MVYCMACGARLPEGARFCSQCGAAAPGGAASASTSATSWHPPQATLPPPTYAPPPQYAPPPVYAAPGPQRVSTGLAIAALILNVFVWPGLGSLVAGRNEGWAQGFLQLIGIILIFTIIGIVIGILMIIGAWAWGIVTGVQLITEASEQRPHG